MLDGEGGEARRASVSSFDPDGAEPRAAKRRARKRYAKGLKADASTAGASEEVEAPAKPKTSAFSRIVELSTVRDRSSCEMRERLEREGYDAAEAAQALERAVECKIVDDSRFAEAFIRGRVSAGKGELVIRRDLKRHDIDVDDLPGWPDAFDMGVEDQCARAVESLGGQKATGKDPYASARRKLESKGYTPAVAHRAVEIWLERRSVS